MFKFKAIVVSALLTAFLGNAALAAGNPGLLLFKDGSMRSVRAGSKMDQMIMPYAKAYDDGMIYAAGGHVYTVPNVRMPNGHMLEDTLSPGNPNYEPSFNR